MLQTYRQPILPEIVIKLEETHDGFVRNLQYCTANLELVKNRFIKILLTHTSLKHRSDKLTSNTQTCFSSHSLFYTN